MSASPSASSRVAALAPLSLALSLAWPAVRALGDDAPAGPVPAPAPAAAEPGATAEPVSAFFFTTQAKVRHSIDLAEIHNGLVVPNPRDGIPAIRKPEAVPASEAVWVHDDDRVIGVAVGDQARAYPILQMQRHEVVNDVLGAVPIAVTYCPLCDSAVAFRRTLPQDKGGKTLTFGISGFLHQSDVLIYDAETETFWQQFTAKAVVGPLTGIALPEVPITTTTWKTWREAHPETTVLSWKTEHGWSRTAYAVDVYTDYHRSKSILFPVRELDRRIHPKTIVHGVVVGDDAVAVPDAAIRAAKEPIGARAGTSSVRFLPAEAGAPVRAERAVAGADGERWEPVPTMRCYWFAWATFHPGSGVAGVPAAAPHAGETPAMDGAR